MYSDWTLLFVLYSNLNEDVSIKKYINNIYVYAKFCVKMNKPSKCEEMSYYFNFSNNYSYFGASVKIYMHECIPIDLVAISFKI